MVIFYGRKKPKGYFGTPFILELYNYTPFHYIYGSLRFKLNDHLAIRK